MGEHKDVGAIWERRSKAGDDYLSLSIKNPDGTTTKFVAFRNKYKEGMESRPDWKIYPDAPKGQSRPEPDDTVDEGDIPF